MKKYATVAVVLVLTLSLLAGCGCTAKDNGMSNMPSTNTTIFPTNIPETTAPTETATQPMTTPATDATDAGGETEMGDTAGTEGGNSNSSTEESGTGSRSRMR